MADTFAEMGTFRSKFRVENYLHKVSSLLLTTFLDYNSGTLCSYTPFCSFQ